MIGSLFIISLIMAFIGHSTTPGYYQKRKMRLQQNLIVRVEHKIAKVVKLFSNPRAVRKWARVRFYEVQLIKIKHPRAFTAALVILSVLSILLIKSSIAALLLFGPIIFLAVQPHELEDTGWVRATTFGNGDDIPAIQLAIDYARLNARPVVYVGPGSWSGGAGDALVFDGASSTWDGITFLGAGAGPGAESTILDFTNLVDNTGVYLTASGMGATRIRNFTMKGFSIEGTATAYYGIRCDYSYEVYLERVHANGFSKATATFGGIFVLSNFQYYLVECVATSCFNGLDLSGNTGTTIGGQALWCTNHGVWMTGTGHKLFGMSIEQNSGTDALRITGDTTTVEKCFFEGNSGKDIQISSQSQFPLLATNIRIIGNRFNGILSLVKVTDTAISVANARNTIINGNTFFNHAVQSIIIGDVDPAFDTANCWNTITANNYTGDFIGAVVQWGDIDPIMINITSRGYNTVIGENLLYELITDAGHFTQTNAYTVRGMKNNSGGVVATGDTIVTDVSDDSGRSVTVSVIGEDPLRYGVIYDGGMAMVDADAASGQKVIQVDDIWIYLEREGETIVIRDDNNSESAVIDAGGIDTAASTITVTVNLTNTYNVADNARVLVAYTDGEFFNVITHGPCEYTRVEGTIDIGVGDELSTFAGNGLLFNSAASMLALALEVYTADNDNGYIKSFIRRN